MVHGEIHEFEHGLFIGEDGFGLDDLTQRAVEGLNGMGGVDGFSDIHGVIKDRDDGVPMAQPDLANGRVLLIPLGGKSL